MADFSKDIRSIPNLITLARVVLLVAALTLYLNGFVGISLIFGFIAGLTDYLDGILARRLGQETYLGAILDQFSDLVLESTMFLMACVHPDGPSPVIFLVYLLREFWVGTIRQFMASKQIEIKSNIWGKIKTNFVSWSFLFWFLHLYNYVPSLEPYLMYLAWFGLVGGIFFGYLSGWMYTKQFMAGYGKM